MQSTSEPLKLKVRRRAHADNPAIDAVLTKIGAGLRTARMSRDVTLADAAARAGLSVQTLQALEQGSPGVSMEALAMMLWQMNMLNHLESVADPRLDEEGQRLAVLRAPGRARGTRIASRSQRATWVGVGLDAL